MTTRIPILLLCTAIISCGDDDGGRPDSVADDASVDAGLSDGDASLATPPWRGRTGAPRVDAGGTIRLADASIDDDPPATAQQIERLSQAYSRSVAAECECLWDDFDYDDEAQCIAASGLDEPLMRCHASVFMDATESEIECKLVAEAELVECLESCGTDAIDCLDRWSIDDAECEPTLAERFYRECIEEA